MACSGKKPIPGLMARGANLAKALSRWALHGFPTVQDEPYQRRLSICAGCELLTQDSICSHRQCGCYVARKAALATEACPIGKWEAETEQIVAPAPKPEKATPVQRPARETKPKAAPATCTHYPRTHQEFDAKSGTITLTAKCQRCDGPMLLDGKESVTVAVG